MCQKDTKGNSVWKMEMVLLQTSYNNLTKERDQLQTSYNNLTTERDQLQKRLEDMTKEKNNLQRNLQGNYVFLNCGYVKFKTSDVFRPNAVKRRLSQEMPVLCHLITIFIIFWILP